jgi:sortase A
MRPLGAILVIAGSAVLVWCGSAVSSATLFPRFESWRLDHILTPGTTVPVPQLLPERPSPAPKPHSVVGRLEIPRLHVSTIVLEGDDEGNLRYGAGHIPWTSLPGSAGNVGIAGRRRTFFGPLRRIARNDRITLRTPDGAYRYSVRSTEIVDPSDVRVLSPSGTPELTLITCYPFYSTGRARLRYVVHAREIGTRE